MVLRILCFLLAFTLTGCASLAVTFTPKKQTIPSHSRLSQFAQHKFWDTLHAGNYAGIPTSEKLLMAAYLENPNDYQLASHLGFLHIWRITERQRLPTNNPTIVDQIILSKKYFADAVELYPTDARTQGFLGDATIIEGKIFHDERQQTAAYFQLKHAIAMWPEFNYFTAGYPMSTLQPNSDQFKQALDWQWQTLNLCAQTRIDKRNPDFSPYMHLENHHGPKRACWNSWIAPHNFEGFFLNMGDMLVKQGDWRTAIKIYKNAKLSKDYASWPYRTMLENHIKNAKTNVANFQTASAHSQSTTMLFNSGYGCVACHQAR